MLTSLAGNKKLFHNNQSLKEQKTSVWSLRGELRGGFEEWRAAAPSRGTFKGRRQRHQTRRWLRSKAPQHEACRPGTGSRSRENILLQIHAIVSPPSRIIGWKSRLDGGWSKVGLAGSPWRRHKAAVWLEGWTLIRTRRQFPGSWWKRPLCDAAANKWINMKLLFKFVSHGYLF